MDPGNESSPLVDKATGSEASYAPKQVSPGKATFFDRFERTFHPSAKRSLFHRKYSSEAITSHKFHTNKVLITRRQWLSHHKKTLNLMHGNVVPTQKTPIEKTMARKSTHEENFLQRTLPEFKPPPERFTQSAYCPKRENLQEGIPITAGHTKRTRVIITDPKPIFVVSTKNKTRPNAKCTLGKAMEIEHLRNEMRLYRINRGDHTSVIPFSNECIKPRCVSQGDRITMRSRSTGRVCGTDLERGVIGQRFKPTAKIRFLLQYIKRK